MLAFHYLTLESGPMTHQGYKEFDVPSSSPNFRTELADKLAELAPEIIADGKLNINKLADLLNDDADSSPERFGLSWPGKRDAQRLAQMPTTATLLPDRDNSVDWDTTQNVFIEGDNLEVLKVLQKHYYGKIKMIYIDPPYNTGKDFVYKDDFRDGVANYLEWTEQMTEGGGKLTSNVETAGRYHSNWLNMMYPRLKLARNLLSHNGVLLVSIDNGEVAGLRLMLNEIFGEQNFVCNLIWIKKEKASGVPPKSMVIPNYEQVLVFSRTEGAFKFFGQERSLASYKLDSEGRHWRTMPIQATGNQNSWFTITNPENGNQHYGNWAFSESTISEMILAGKIKFPKSSSGKPEQIVYADELANQSSPIFANIGRFDSEISTRALNKLLGGKIFDFPKPVDLLKFLVKQSCDQNSIILDFFAGSGTTAHAVIQLNAEDGGNRRCVSVQLPEPTPENSSAREANFETVADISRERIRRAGKKIIEGEAAKLDGRAETLDVGFRAYKLADTNFAKWKINATIEENELENLFDSVRDSANDASSPEELFTETILKLGLSLTEQYKQKELAGLTVFSVDHDLILGYFDEKTKPSLDQLRELVELAEVRLIVLEDAFQGDDELKTNLVQLCKTRGIELSIA